MNCIARILLLTLLLVGVIPADVRGADEVMRQGVFHPDFRSLQVTVNNNPLAPPVITLYGDDRVVISFDELSDDRRYMRYELIHCDAHWRPEGLVDSEFLDGFNQGEVEDYAWSEATTVHYVHYRIVLPNAQMRFTVSGNYIVRVYPEDDPETTLLQARFSVSEMAVGVAGDVTTATDIDYNRSHQQVEFSVNVGEYPVEDLYNDLLITVAQDGRNDNIVTLRQPLRLQGRTAIYEHLRPLIFDAGNEYRRIETVTTRYPSMGVEGIDYLDPYYHIFLRTDAPRAYGEYEYDRTQFGRFFVREYDSTDSDVQADYIVTHFALDMPRSDDFDIFIDSDITGRAFDEGSMMNYNNATGRYEKILLLKQGAYNYQYLAVPKGTMTGRTATVEGDYYPTQHEYTVNVYHRPRGSRYDRLIGSTVIYSNR